MIIAPIVAGLEKLFCRIPWFVKLYLMPYALVLRREIDLAKIDETDLVLNVGCGAIPFSAIYIARETGAKVYAIDKDLKAVKKARECVKAMKLTDRITVCRGNGENLSALTEKVEEKIDFSVALVALQARPKKEIIQQLLAAGKKGVRVIVRKPKAHLSIEYDMLPLEFAFQGEVSQNMRTFDGSVLYKQGA